MFQVKFCKKYVIFTKKSRNFEVEILTTCELFITSGKSASLTQGQANPKSTMSHSLNPVADDILPKSKN